VKIPIFGKNKATTIAGRFAKDDGNRLQRLESARFAAALTKPWVLPPQNQDKNTPLPQSFQSLGTRGINAMTGQVLMDMYPLDRMWVRTTLTPRVRYSEVMRANPAALQMVEDKLFLRDLILQSTIEGASLGKTYERGRAGFRSHQRAILDHGFITGDMLEHIDRDYRMRYFRLDQYVTKRDSYGDVIYHITVEDKDPLELHDEQLGKLDLRRDKLEEQTIEERTKKLHTIVEIQPFARTWCIRQEFDSKTLWQAVTNKKGEFVRAVDEIEEPVSPYFSTPYELIAGEDYGRGFIDQVLGDLRMFDNGRERMADWAANASLLLWGIDKASHVRTKDLQQPTGSVIRNCDVKNGQIQDIGPLRLDKLADFNVFREFLETVREDLMGSMLIPSGSVRDSERTTATEINAISIRERESALGGTSASFMERKNLQLFKRVEWQLVQDEIMPDLGAEVELRVQTGLAALSREIDNQKLQRALAQVGALATLNPEGARRVDVGTITKIIFRQMGVEEPGVLFTDEQMEKQTQAAIAAQLQAAAGQQAIKSGGAIVEQAAAGNAAPAA